MPTKALRRFITEVCPFGLDDFTVIFRPAEAGSVFEGEAINKTATVWISRSYQPCQIFSRKLHKYGYISHEIVYFKPEIIYYLIAHELRHLWQGNVRLGRYKLKTVSFQHIYGPMTVWPAKERDACKYGSMKLAEFRKRMQDSLRKSRLQKQHTASPKK